MNNKITLTAKTLKGKNIIFLKGKHWRIVRTSDSVKFSTDTGPWLLCIPEDHYDKHNVTASRWIHKHNDKNFDLGNKKCKTSTNS